MVATLSTAPSALWVSRDAVVVNYIAAAAESWKDHAIYFENLMIPYSYVYDMNSWLVNNSGVNYNKHWSPGI